MMGIKQRQQHLFNYQVNLDKRVRSDHPLRRINEIIDLLSYDIGLRSITVTTGTSPSIRR